MAQQQQQQKSLKRVDDALVRPHITRECNDHITDAHSTSTMANPQHRDAADMRHHAVHWREHWDVQMMTNVQRPCVWCARGVSIDINKF